MTIDIPDDLARKLEPKLGRLAEIIRRGLGELGPPEAGDCGLADEVLAFLSRGPQPEEIVAFRPSKQSVERVRDLLDKNRQGVLTTEEEAEMDYIQSLNQLFSLIKVHARQRLRPSSRELAPSCAAPYGSEPADAANTGRIIGITAVGRATAALLQFNTANRVRLRAELQQAGRYPQIGGSSA